MKKTLKKLNLKFLAVMTGLFFLTTVASAKPTVTVTNSPGENIFSQLNTLVPSATFQKMWIDYDVKQGGRTGMIIHTSFKVYNMKGIEGYLALYFQYKDGTPLDDTNGKFDSADSTVAAYRAISPGYATTVYDDYTIFMPYAEFDLDDGDYKLRIDADVIYKEGGVISHLTYYDFVYTQE